MIISTEQFNAAFKKLPFPIRDYIASDELAPITEEIGTKYGLHVDTVGALYREATNTLLGLMNPSQLMNELKSIGISDANIAPIIQELNEKVFLPLQEKMKRMGDTDPYQEDARVSGELSTAEPTPVPPAPAPTAPATPPISAPRMQPPPIPAAPQPVPPPVMTPPPQAPPAPMPLSTPAMTPSPSPMPAPEPPQAFIRTMGEDMQAVQAHQEPQMHPFAAASVPAPTPAPAPRPVSPTPTPSPASMPPVPPAPQPVPPPVVTPPAMPVPPPMPPMPRSTPPVPPHTAPKPAPASQSANREELSKVLKNYGVDPYREPIE